MLSRLNLFAGAVLTSLLLAAAPAPAPVPGAGLPQIRPAATHVQPNWQRRLLADAADSRFTEAWGLFSSGGWADNGQVMVFANADRSQTRLEVVPAARAAVAADRPLSADEAKSFFAVVTGSLPTTDLNEPAFDGVVYEFVHVQKNAKAVPTATNRLLIRSRGAPPQPAYDNLVASFLALKTAALPPKNK